MKILKRAGHSIADQQHISEFDNDIAEPRWMNLYRIGGVAALIAALIAIIEVIIEINGSSLTSAPITVLGWFTLLQTDKILGLALLGIFEVAYFPLSMLMFLALYPALRKISESLSATAFIVNLIATTAYLSNNIALSMVSLSNQYFVATTDTQRSTLLAAGQAMLAQVQGTGFNLAFIFGSIAGVAVSVAMLRSQVFSKSTAIVGIIANVLGLPGAALGPILFGINGLLVLVWIVMIGIRLLKIRQKQ